LLGKIEHHGGAVLQSLSLWPHRSWEQSVYMKGDLELSSVKASVALRVSGSVEYCFEVYDKILYTKCEK